MKPFDRRRLLRNGLLVTGAAAPLVAFGGAGSANADEKMLSNFDGGPASGTAADGSITPNSTLTGVQFTASMAAYEGQRWFTYNWPASWHVIWHVVSTTPRPGVIQVNSSWSVERASVDYITYWITIFNVSDAAINIEARFAVLNLG